MENFMSKLKSVVRDAPATMAFIIINIAIFIVLNALPGTRDQLLLNHELHVILQRPWTLVTVFFSQEVHFHLALNMGLFFFFGKEMEKHAGSAVVMATYMICGFLAASPFPLLPLSSAGRRG